MALASFAIWGFFKFAKTTPTMPGEGGIDINFISQFNPFGTSTKTPPTTPPTDVSGYQPGAEGETVKLKLTKISSMPIAGYTVFSKERLKEINPFPTLPLTGQGDNLVPPAKGGTGGLSVLTEFIPNLRYVEKATGNIYQTFADLIVEKKFSGTIIPKVYDAYFGNNGESVVMRYLKGDSKTIETFVGTLPKELLGADPNLINETKGAFLPDNVKDISISPDGTKIFYLFKSGDNMIGTILNFLTNKKVQVFDSPFTEWLSQWGNNKTINLTTKPSANIPGYMYSTDDAGKNLNRVLGNINGLTTLSSPDGKLILYGNSNLTLNIYHMDTRTSDSAFGIKTLPEKCVWGELSDVFYCSVPKFIDSGSYPDSWYQGEVSFNDNLWKIDAKNGNTTLLLDPSAFTTEQIDGIKLSLDENENYLFFVNKKDSSFWEYMLK